MRLSPVPTPPLGTGSFLPRSSESLELKLTLELSHWHRSALLYTHGRKLHKGRKTCSAAGRDTWTEQGTNLQTLPQQCLSCLAAAGRAITAPWQKGHETKHKHHHFFPSSLPVPGKWERQANRNIGSHSNIYVRLPTLRICHNQPPLLSIFSETQLLPFFLPSL